MLARAKQHGASEADVIVADGETLSVQVRLDAVDRLTKAREKRLGLRMFVGKRSASASTSDFSKPLRQFVADTCTLAKQSWKIPYPACLIRTADKRPSGSRIYDSTTLQTEQQIDLAKRVETAALKARSAITNSEGADFDSSWGRVMLATSHGFLGQYSSSSFSLAVSPIASDPDTGAMQRDSWYDVQRKFSKLDQPEDR